MQSQFTRYNWHIVVACALVALIFLLYKGRACPSVDSTRVVDGPSKIVITPAVLAPGTTNKALPSVKGICTSWQPYYNRTGGNSHNNTNIKWLITIVSPSYDISRRHVLRSTWMRYFPLPGVDVDFLFFVSRVPATHRPLVDWENCLFGDVVELDIEENIPVAYYVKPIIWYTYLIDKGIMQNYEYISKLDDDNYFYPQPFVDQYLVPHRGQPMRVMGRNMKSPHQPQNNDLPFNYPGGQAYHMSLDVYGMSSMIWLLAVISSSRSED